MDALSKAALDAWTAGQLGDFRPANAIAGELASSDALGAPAWLQALSALSWSAAPDGEMPCGPGDVAVFEDAPRRVRAVAALTCSEGVRWSIQGFDRAAVREWVGVAERLLREPEPALPESGVWLAWARVWTQLVGDAPGSATEAASALERQAAALGHAPLVVEAAAQRALAVVATGDLTEATSVARRASRMARTEAIPQQEYLAHLVLSRVRRLTGHPHLATRILKALRTVASPTWHPWIDWELVMAGAVEETGPHGPGALSALRSALEHAAAGAGPAFGSAAAALERHALDYPPLRTDVDAVLCGCDATRAPSDDDVARWCAGQTSDTPPALHGLLTRRAGAPEADSAIAYAVDLRGIGRRRVPRLGFALLPLEGVTVLAQTRRKQGRVETVVAALTLAGDAGVEEAACFAEVYGFPFEPAVHKNIFDVLLHRARDYVGDAGALERSEGWARLRLTRPLVVPDPRCSKPVQDRLLRAVAQIKGATAKQVAEAVGMSLRVAQNALSELAADGACLVRRDGRRVEYVVEDTTFSEPTVHG